MDGSLSFEEARVLGCLVERFEDQTAVEAALAGLISREGGPLVIHRPSGGGRRAATYAHLLCGEASPQVERRTGAEIVIPPDPDRLSALEEKLAALDAELSGLRARFEALEAALGGPGGAEA